MTRKRKLIQKVIIRFLIVVIVFFACDFILNQLADLRAYRDPYVVSEAQWNEIMNKAKSDTALTEDDYNVILSQTGLGKPAVDKLVSTQNFNKLQEYRNYYVKSKDFVCVREGSFACHDYITDENGKRIKNPDFADLQDGDIIITYSIHSFGWRHGHAAIVTNAKSGKVVQAVMIGEKSDFGHVAEWNCFPLVAVLRAKDLDEETRRRIADYAEDNLVGLDYSMLAGVFGNDEKPIESTQCAHLVWYAYKQFGVDIDYNQDRIITPKDIFKCDKLEIVQIYGNIDKV